MTNDTTPHAPENEALAEAAAAIAAITTDTVSISELAAAADAAVDAPPAEPAPPSFDDLGLHPDVKLALDDMGYFTPTPVQTAVYKPVSEGKDLMVQSRTGTGKTTAFGLPIVSKIVPTHRAPQALILTPTRELALQVARELAQIGKHRGVIIECVYGGAPIGKQIKALRDGVHIVVGTPGRVLDHIGRRTLDCRTVSMFVLDECDEMLSMGFLEDIERVVSHLPEKKQTMLFSATMPDEVTRYARRHMNAPETIALSRDGVSVAEIHHAYYIVSGIARSRDLLKILFQEDPESAIIFCNTRDETTMVAKFLQKQGLDAEPLSSDLSQADRERVMGRMKQHNLRFLCATDVAARGIDISNLSHVINYMVPEAPEIYVHRTGRTGRAGKKGVALSLVGPRELGSFRYVRLTYGIKPEERVLPKDDIFVGKLKVPLPPIGKSQPPDPIQILMRGVVGTPSDLERQIFEKLLAKADGKRVLAQLVAEKLNLLSMKSKPKRPPAPPREEHAEASGEHPVPASSEGGPSRFDDRGRPPRRFEDGDRPRFRDGGGGGGEGSEGRTQRFERGDRGGSGGGGGGSDGGEGRTQRFERGDRPRDDRGEARTDRFDRDRPRRDRDGRDGRDGRDRHERGNHERGERSFDRDRGDRPDRGGERQDRPEQQRPPEAVATEPTNHVVTTEPGTEAAPPVEVRQEPRDRDRNDRGGGDRGGGDRGGGDRGGGDRGGGDRDRGDRRPDRERSERHGGDRDRGDRDRGRDRDRGDRDRHERRDHSDTRIDVPVGEVNAVVETAMEAPIVEAPPLEIHHERARRDTLVDVGAEAAPQVDDVARAALERADRNKTGGKRDKKSAPTAETREFWETWAEEKSTRPAEPAPTAPAAAAADETAEERPARDGRGGKGRDRDRGRGRDKKPDKADAKADAKSDAKSDDKHERRGKKADAAPAAAAATADGAQARLFISLGKKHGVSADDLRALLSGPIGGDKARIGSVSLRDSHAHVRVPEDLVDAIITGVHGTQHNEHEVTVERARA